MSEATLKNLLFAVIWATLFGPEARAEIIPADRRTEWKPGVTHNGGIPNRTTIYATLNPSEKSDEEAIQTALDNCPPNQVVLLGPGIFHLSGTGVGLRIKRSDITLRGSGPLKTRILQKRADEPKPIIIVGALWFDWEQQTLFSTDGVKGTKSVTLQGNPGLQVGELVHVNETYDSSLTMFNPNPDDGQINDYLGWGEGRVQKGVGGSRLLSRPIGQAMQITAINGNQITFSTPFHMNFRTSYAARLARLTTDTDPIGRQPVTRVGIEDLSMGYGGGGDGGGNIRMFAAAYCWAKNIESDHALGAAFAFDGCFRCEVRDSFLHTTANPHPGGGGYGLVFDRYAADCLAENNISWNFNKVMVMRSSGGGNVIGYNYMQDGYGASYPNQVENGLNASHMTTPHMELFEGNESFNFSGDSRWGNSIYVTAFRNHLTGQRSIAPPLNTHTSSYIDGTRTLATDYFEDEYNRRAIGLSRGHYWYNFVGNVLGYDGMTLLTNPASFYKVPQTAFAYEGDGNGGVVPMWNLGEGDAKVQTTASRHGNFDYATRTTVWDGANADHALPDSLYLTAKPEFFGSTPWPSVRPENPLNPIVGELPAKSRFHALVYPNASVPTILARPTNQIINLGETATFAVAAAFAQPLTYQWFFEGQDIPGATGATLTVANAQVAQAGRYMVNVTAPSGEKTHAAAELNFTFARVHMFAGLKVEGQPGKVYRIEFANTDNPTNWGGFPLFTNQNSTAYFIDWVLQPRHYRASALAAGEAEPKVERTRAPGLSVEGVIGQKYRIEYADALQSPNAWRELKTFTLFTSSEVFIDYDFFLPNYSRRFYRAVPAP